MTERKSLPYATYDVFTDTPFGGNPLAIVWDADDLTDDALQRIAREFNYSETVFILKPQKTDNAARLRIFTPNQELPFAGHPTIGAITALYERGHVFPLTLELGVGPLKAHCENGIASIHATQKLEQLAQPETDLIARTLGLEANEILSKPVMASLGVPFTFTEVASRAALSNVQIDLLAMRDGNTRYPSGRDFSQAVFWLEPHSPERQDAGSQKAISQKTVSQKTGVQTVHLRMFAPLDSIPEDPATGSASAALAALMFETSGTPVSLNIRQGDDMGRASIISAKADSAGVTIGGTAIKMMEGKLLL